MTCHVLLRGLDEASLARIVAAGGGEYVGLQPVKNKEPLVLFNVPETGTTLSVPPERETILEKEEKESP